MDRELTDTELALVSRIKSETEQAQSSATPVQPKLISLERFGIERKTKRAKGEKRSLIPLAIGLAVTGVLVTLAFIIFMQSTAEQMGSLDYFTNLSEQLAGSEEFNQLFNSTGLGWYKDFVKIYEQRWMLSGVIFSAFFLLAALTFVIDLARRGNK